MPALQDMPPGCRFNNRCSHTIDQCRTHYPNLDGQVGEHRTACHRWQEVTPVMNTPLLEVNDLKVYFPVKGGILMRAKNYNKAVDGVSIHVNAGETLGLVGESGCGKSTLGKAIVRLLKPTEGQIIFDGNDISTLSASELKPIRRDIQMIFQDPGESLNSRLTVGALIGEPFEIHNLDSPESRRRKVLELLDQVGLPANAIDRYPFEFSGGQRQRIGIARAI